MQPIEIVLEVLLHPFCATSIRQIDDEIYHRCDVKLRIATLSYRGIREEVLSEVEILLSQFLRLHVFRLITDECMVVVRPVGVQDSPFLQQPVKKRCSRIGCQ